MLLQDSYRRIFEEFFQEEIAYHGKIMQFDFSSYCQYGFLFKKFKDRDKRILYLAQDIKNTKIEDVAFQNHIACLEKHNINKEIAALRKKREEVEGNCCISQNKLELVMDYLEEFDFSKFIKYYNSIYSGLAADTGVLSYPSEDYVILRIIELLFECYKCTLRFEVPEESNLTNLYLSKGISLDKDVQFAKYKLITIDDNFEITESNIPKVYDKRIDTHVLIKEMPVDLLYLFKNLRLGGFIESLALRPDYSLAGEGFLNLTIVLEELERGKLFSLSQLGSPLISKLYSCNFDTLWVNIDKENMIFEEIVQDFYVYNDNIVTQVVHLEYKLQEPNPIITHIDHEYIFYSIDEYENRQSDCRQKGTSKARYKTFKIDRSRIPFCVNGGFFPYLILEKYFKEIGLLKEYFASVLL